MLDTRGIVGAIWLVLITPGCSAPAKSASASTPASTEPALREAQTNPVEPDPSSPSTSPAVPPSDDPILADLRGLLDQARKAKEARDFAGARAQIVSAIEKALAEIGTREDLPALVVLTDLGNFAHGSGELRAAEKARRRVLEVFSHTLSDDHSDLQWARLNLAVTIKRLGDLAGARVLEEKALEVRSRTLPDDHPDLQVARLSLANTLYALGDLAGARALYEKSLEVDSRTLPDDHPDLQAARLNLAITKYSLGDLQGARALEEKVLEVFSRTLPDDHPNLQAARGNLAATMADLGDLAGAQTLAEKVLEVFSRTLPDDHPDLQKARQSLAVVSKALGDLAGARALEEKVLEVLSRALPDDHPYLQIARGNLAATLYALGDLAGARALQEKVLEVSSRTLPDDHADLQMARLNLAGTIKALGDLAGARALEEKVLEVDSFTLPDDHPELQDARSNLAVTIADLGDLVGARALFEKVHEVDSRTLPDDHPDLQKARQDLAVTIATESARLPGGREEARESCAKLILALCQAQTHAIRTVLLKSPSREAEERCARLAEKLDIALAIARGYGVFARSPELEAPAFVLCESARGAAIDSSGLARRAAGAPTYAELREALVKTSDELAALAQEGTTSEAFDAARMKREKAEGELIALAREAAGGGLGGIDLNVSSLSHRLGQRAASVSFRRFKDLRIEVAEDPGAKGHSAPREISTESLCAFVVRGSAVGSRGAGSSSPLTVLYLGPIEPIETAIREWRESLGVAEGRGIGVSGSSGAAARDRNGSGDRLRRLVFDPLLPAIGDCDHILIEADDVLHLVAFDALALDPSATALLGDQWRIETRATLTELFENQPASKGGGLVALGGASFNAEPANPSEEQSTRVESDGPTQVAAMLRGGVWESGFPPLPQSGEEARGIAELYRRAFGAAPAALVLENRRASREAVNQFAPKARYLHLATHGWSTSESIRSWNDPKPIDVKSGLGLRQSGEEQVKGMSPMLLCGLALAGANLSENAVGRAPGLVTAEELSAFDLSNCELAVLSACDTNVGERRAGQGVASFQRALQMAGARSVITSLWKVPDEATKELMLDFYRRIWVEKKPKGQALWEAKKKIREAKDERGFPKYSTRDWAAWVLTGDPN